MDGWEAEAPFLKTVSKFSGFLNFQISLNTEDYIRWLLVRLQLKSGPGFNSPEEQVKWKCLDLRERDGLRVPCLLTMSLSYLPFEVSILPTKVKPGSRQNLLYISNPELSHKIFTTSPTKGMEEEKQNLLLHNKSEESDLWEGSQKTV